MQSEILFKVRVNARVVAILDFIFSTFELLCILGLAGLLLYIDSIRLDEHFQASHFGQDESGSLTLGKDKKHLLVWGLILVVLPLQFLQFWSCIQLMKSTSINQTAAQSLSMAKNYKNITIAFLLLSVVTASLSMIIVLIIIRGSFLCIVNSYIFELKQIVEKEYNSNAVVVPAQVV